MPPSNVVPPSSAVEWDKLKFGLTPVHSHIEHKWRDGKWDSGRLVNDPNLSLHVACVGLHYGQSCFEGLKAFRSADGSVRIFRPQENSKRLNRSADALMMPEVSESMFLEACRRVTSDNLEFVPPHAPGATRGSMYLRPMLFASGPELLLVPPEEFTFLIYVTPVGSLYGVQTDMPGVDALVLDDFDRAAPKGTGSFKLAGNYGPVFKHAMSAKKQGYGITLHLDSATRTLIDEFSTSNLLAISHGSSRGAARAETAEAAVDGAAQDVRLVVPASDSILRSVTTMSICDLAESFGWTVERRPVPFAELVAGAFDEIAAAGTAAAVTPVGSVSFTARALGQNGDKTTKVMIGSGSMGACFDRVLKTLTSIQSGDIKDQHGWLWPAEGVAPPAANGVNGTA